MAERSHNKKDNRLRALIEEATVDCNDESDEHMGFMNMIEENVVCPFPAKVLGEDVEVIQLQSPAAGFGLDAVCRYKGKDYQIDVRSLVFPTVKPKGFEWIEAYRSWLGTLG
jgi:hypothetical protein